MQVSVVPALDKRKKADLLVIPFWKGQKKAKPVAALGSLGTLCKSPLDENDFVGDEGEHLFLYPKSNLEPRICLLGLGKEQKLTVDTLRRAFASLTRACHKKKVTSLNVLLPNIVELREITPEECLKGVAEGIFLANYQYNKYFGTKDPLTLLQKVHFVGVLPKALKVVHEIAHVCEAVYMARDLVNGNAKEVTPAYLAKVAQSMGKKFSTVKAEVFDKKRIIHEKMGLFLAVGQGAAVDPAFIILSHKGNPRSKDHTVLVGKGVTYDTGGLNLKPTGYMETMREDMSGSATVLATIYAAAKLNLKVNVTAVVAATENAIDAKSFKPGDVFVGRTGKSVEIGNTDAEGRLTLADALSYAADHLAPTRMIDLATLTGSVVIALGEGMAGLMSNNDDLADQLADASFISSEPVWRLPLYAPYKEQLKSDVADINNVGGRPAGSITAALFLQEFVGDVPWAHLDIAGTAFSKKEKHTVPKNGVGFGVRLLVEFLRGL